MSNEETNNKYLPLYAVYYHDRYDKSNPNSFRGFVIGTELLELIIEADDDYYYKEVELK